MKCWKASCSQLLQCLITQEILSTALKAWPAGNCVYVTLRIKWITCKCVFQKAAHRTGFRDLFDVTERSLPLSGQCFLTFLHYNSLSSVYHLQTFVWILWWSEYCFVNSCTSNSRLRMQFTLHKNISQMHKCININLQYQFWYYGKNNCFWFFEKLFEIHIYIRNDSTCYLWCPPGFCYWPYFIFIVYVAPWLNF